MVVDGTDESHAATELHYDRLSELKAFDDTKAGVKGLVDAGITKVPPIFIHPLDDHNFDKFSDPEKTQFSFPIIDLDGINKDPIQHKEIVDKVRDASETWGFFQVINHGIPVSILEEMIDGVRRFFEQDTEVKKQWYTRDTTKRVIYNCNFDLYSAPAANWRDSVYCTMAPNPPNPEELPPPCREIQIEYTNQVLKFGSSLFGILSEALGLNPNHLRDMNCDKGLTFLAHCYPACPQPELTLGTTKHTDDGFLTVLLQDQIGGLQILHQDHWIDVPPTPGALVLNIGDLLQLISNDKFISVEHRVVANYEGPRVSVACFFSTYLMPSSKMYGPIKELLSEDIPPNYRETTVHDYMTYSTAKELGVPRLLYLKL